MKKEFVAGLVLGAIFFGATPAIASGIIAELSSQPIYVDGVQVEMTAYTINGNNYVKLRDIGEAVDFGVDYDAASNSVHIDTSTTYVGDNVEEEITARISAVADMVTVTHTGSNEVKDYYTVTVENTTTENKLSNGADISEANINAMVDEVLAIFPDDSEWGAPANNGDEYSYCNSLGCASFTYMVEDIVWGTMSQPVYSHYDLSQVKAGDAVYLYNAETGDAHWIFVTGTRDGGDFLGTMICWVAGNSGATLCVTEQSLASRLIMYPDSIVYCYY